MSRELARARLGYISERRRDLMLTKGLLKGMAVDKLRSHERAAVDHAAQRMGDSSKQPTPHRRRDPSQATRPFHTIWSDVGCPSVQSFSGAKYFVSFVDEFTRYSVVYPMRSKDEVPERFKQFLRVVRLMSERLDQRFRVVRLKTDGGGEYSSAEFRALIDDNDINHLMTPPETPEMNSIAESYNRVVVRLANKMMVGACLATPFWALALVYANYVRNLLPLALFGHQSPHQRLFGEVPNLRNVRLFGCDAYVHKHSAAKFGTKAVKGIMVGIPPEGDRWYIFHPETRTVTKEKHVVFVEDMAPRRNHLREYDDLEEGLDVEALSVPIGHFEKDFDSQVRRLQVRRLFTPRSELGPGRSEALPFIVFSAAAMTSRRKWKGGSDDGF